MSFWTIAWRNMQQRGLASSLTALNMALGVAVMVCVIVIHSVTVRQFSQDAQGYHLIVGSGKGSPLELVLSTVFHISKPLYPIPYAAYRDFTDGKYADVTEVAVPYCLGDSFVAGDDVYRVIGTTPDLFDKIEYGANDDGSGIGYAFRDGRNMRLENCFEAVVGSVVASRAGLKVGDRFNPTHGIGKNGDKHDAFEIVGVLDSTGTANDRAVFVNIEGFYLLDGHALAPKDEAEAAEIAVGPPRLDEPRGQLIPAVCFDNEGNEVEPLAEELREVTSVLVLCNSNFGPRVLLGTINKDSSSSAQVVAPGGVVASLLDKIIAPVQVVLLVLTVLVVVVAAVGILVSIYNSMSERAHDIAVMRALGASRTSVMAIVLFESILLAVLGGVIGLALGHGLVGLAAPVVEARTGVQIAALSFDRWEA
ncbi:MAG: FtsX-like permease family protein, partial [Planctomycetota bacterium]